MSTITSKGGPGKPGSREFFEDEDFQDGLVRLLTENAERCKELAPLLTSEDFKPVRGMQWGNQRWVIAGRVLEHYEKYCEPIGKLLRSDVLQYAKELQLNSRQVLALEDYLAHLAEVPLGNDEALVAKVRELKTQHLRALAIQELIDLQSTGQLTDEKWHSITETALSASATTTEEPTSADVIYNAKFAEPQFTLSGKLPTGLAMLAAKPKAGKTWLGLQLSLSVVRNEPFLKSSIRRPGPVLYFALEDTERRISERLKLLTANATGLEQFDVLYEYGGAAALRARLERRSYQLVVIDPFLAIAPVRKTQDIVRADYRELQPLRKLATDFGCTILLIHHLRKASGESHEVILGTTGVTAALDTIWVLTNDPASDNIKLLHIIGRDVRERKLKLEFGRVPGASRAPRFSWRVLAEGPETEARGPLQERILGAPKTHGPLSLQDVVAATKGEYNSVAATLSKMRAAGMIRKQQPGRYCLPKPRLIR